MPEVHDDPAATRDEPVGAPRPSATQDELSVTGIECFGHHGVLAREKADGQPFLVDLTLGLDTRTAARSDDLADTVDYGALVLSVKHVVETGTHDLIERVVQEVADVCLEHDRVEWARVTLHKPQAPIQAPFSDVTLTITRKREAPSE